MNTPVFAELLRGIPLEATPIRIGRCLPPAETVTGEGLGAQACTAEESAVRRGYDVGLQQGREEGLRAGHEEGVRQGMEEALARSRAATERAVAEARAPLQKQEERLRGCIDALTASMPDCRGAMEDELVALCYEAVCHVFGRMALDPGVVRSHLQHLLSRWAATPAIELHVHPQDAEALDRADAAHEPPTSWRWVADPEVALGGCVVVGRGGGIDARLETALEACKAALLEQRSQRRAAQGEPS